MTNQVLDDIAYDIVNRGLGHWETIDLIKNYYGIRVDFRTKQGKALLEQIYERAKYYE